MFAAAVDGMLRSVVEIDAPHLMMQTCPEQVAKLIADVVTESG
ncbi:hypothetical protein AB0J48_28250 [Nocardia salmonicida]